MLIEEGLITYLLAQSGVTAYVGEQIHFVHAPQNVTAPYIIIIKISGVREHSHDGSSELAHPRFQLSVFANTYSEVKGIASALQTVLQTYSGTMGSVNVDVVFYDNEVDMYEQETGLYHTALDYIIWHTES